MIFFHTTRTHYSAKEASERSLTIGELIAELENYDEDEKIVFCNDSGYTYGAIRKNLISEDTE